MSLKQRLDKLAASRPGAAKPARTPEERMREDRNLYWPFSYGLEGAESPSDEFLRWLDLQFERTYTLDEVTGMVIPGDNAPKMPDYLP